MNTRAKGDFEASARNWMLYPAIAVLVGLFAVLLYAIKVADSVDILRLFGFGIAYCGAALLMGTLLGIIFGIPKKLSEGESASIRTPGTSESAMKRQKFRYDANTNLIAISDWLTKILVGVGLVEAKSIGIFFENVASYASIGFGASDSSQPFALSLLCYYLIDGFLLGYFWCRLFLLRLLENAETKDLDQSKASSDSFGALTATGGMKTRSDGGPTAPTGTIEQKILLTLWRLQALHAPDLSKAITFTMLPAAPEYADFIRATNQLIEVGFVAVSPEGQYLLTANGLMLCQTSVDDFPQSYWYEDIVVPVANIETLKRSIAEKIKNRE